VDLRPRRPYARAFRGHEALVQRTLDPPLSGTALAYPVVVSTTPPPVIPPDLPGADLVCAGLDDLRVGKVTPPALLLLGARERLRQSGIQLPEAPVEQPERALYLLLEDEDPGGAHARYNALRQRLVSFCTTFEQLARRRHS
jgi:hypothetical protein